MARKIAHALMEADWCKGRWLSIMVNVLSSHSLTKTTQLFEFMSFMMRCLIMISLSTEPSLIIIALLL